MSGLVVQPISTTEAVVASLRARILDGEIEPGVRLPEQDLAMEFGVARPTVRAAIQTLCHEGLLVRERNRSAHIPVLTRDEYIPVLPDEILDLFSVRIPLECLVVRQVLERGAPLTPAREAMAVMEALPDDAGWSQVVAADAAFHRSLVTAVGSPRLGDADSPPTTPLSQVVAADAAFHLSLVRGRLAAPRAPVRRLERRDPALRRPAAAELGVAVGDRARASRGARRARDG